MNSPDRADEKFSPRIGALCAVAVVFILVGITLVSRLGYASSLSMLDIAALRFGIGGALLLPIVLRHGLSGVPLRAAIALTLFGGLGFALFAYSGIRLAPAAHAAVLLHGTLPLITGILLRFVGQAEAFRPRPIGLALIAAGIVAMLAESLHTTSTTQLAGDLCLLLAAIFWASFAILAARLGLAPLRAAAIISVLSMCVYLPVYAFLPGGGIGTATLASLATQAGFHGIVLGTLSVFIYARAVASLGAGTVALITATVPCITTLAAIPLLGERPGVAAIAGVVLVSGGMLAAIGGGPFSALRARWQDAQIERAELLHLTDRELGDIGLSRINVRQLIDANWWQDPEVLEPRVKRRR
jgi:drug/metabolite transporter (DMT)-like permease